MALSSIPFDEQIAWQEAAVLTMKKRHDVSVDKLVSKKKELESKEVMELLKTTTRTFDEIKAFLMGENPTKDEE